MSIIFNTTAVLETIKNIEFTDLTENQSITTIALATLTISVAAVYAVKRCYNYLYPLQSLNLSNTRLTQAPDVSKNSQLETLNLSNNQLTQAPDLSKNSQLQWLDLSNTRLTQAPDLSRNSQLQVLYLSNTQLTQAPDLSKNSQLRWLNLSDNQLTHPPDVSKNSQLQWLYLSNTRLTQAPDVSKNSQLRWLFLSDNQLTLAPDVSKNSQLRWLFLSDNQLTRLPDSILTLSENCEVSAERNRFTPEYIEQFQRRLEEHRRQHPGQGPHVIFSVYEGDEEESFSLDEQLTQWSKEFQTGSSKEEADSSSTANVSFKSLLALEKNVQQPLATYLARLRGTKDYTTPEGKQNIALRVQRMLTLAETSADFRNEMLDLIREGLGACGDRVCIMFNDIEILWQFYQPMTRDEARRLGIRAGRYERLKGHALEQHRLKQLSDDVETILKFHLELKKELDLPITTKGMLYERIAGVTDEMKNEAKKMISTISEEELLASSPQWAGYLKRHYKEKIEATKAKYHALLEQVGEYYFTEGNQRAAFLEKNQDLREFLETHKPAHYDEAAKKIDALLKAEIAGIK